MTFLYELLQHFIIFQMLRKVLKLSVMVGVTRMWGPQNHPSQLPPIILVCWLAWIDHAALCWSVLYYPLISHFTTVKVNKNELKLFVETYVVQPNIKMSQLPWSSPIPLHFTNKMLETPPGFLSIHWVIVHMIITKEIYLKNNSIFYVYCRSSYMRSQERTLICHHIGKFVNPVITLDHDSFVGLHLPGIHIKDL